MDRSGGGSSRVEREIDGGGRERRGRNERRQITLGSLPRGNSGPLACRML